MKYRHRRNRLGRGERQGWGKGEGRRRHTPPGRGLGRMLKDAQRNEMTEYVVYTRLAKQVKNKENKSILREIAKEERKHAEFWESHTKEHVKPRYLRVLFHILISKVLGLSFGLKLMERGEDLTKDSYDTISKHIPEVKQIETDEDEHENKILSLIDEGRLMYVSSMVLGVSDAIVELTGALAGLTFALQNTNLIALTGLITGIAASFSMGGSEYLATKSEKNGKSPSKAALYTGAMYLLTVILLILPYLLINQVFYSLGITLFIALLIILCFTFYISVAQEESFKKRFLEMASISMGVSLLSFFIGIFIRKYFGIEI